VIAIQPKFPKVYAGLADVIAAPADQRASKLHAFVSGWYRHMKPIYWHDNHLATDAYFGYWCFEAALVAMVFSIDDATLHDHPHYPTDLTRHHGETA
jgi:hypothetical protein